MGLTMRFDMIHLWANTFHLSCHTFSLPERTFHTNQTLVFVIVLSLLFYLLAISHPHLNFHLRVNVFDMRCSCFSRVFSLIWIDSTCRILLFFSTLFMLIVVVSGVIFALAYSHTHFFVSLTLLSPLWFSHSLSILIAKKAYRGQVAAK